jgi:hypothetical protein
MTLVLDASTFVLAFENVSGSGESLPLATEAEALEGTANDSLMTPLRTAQVIDAIPDVVFPDPILFATDAEAEAGTATNIIMSPHAVSAWYAALAIAISKVTGLQAALDALAAGQINGNFAFATKAAMDADLAHAAGTTAVVYADTDANNGSYVKVGASGSGSWSRYSAETVVSLDARTSILQQITASPASEDGFVVTDEVGNALFQATTTDLRHPYFTNLEMLLAANSAAQQIRILSTAPASFAVTDPIGNAIMYVDDETFLTSAPISGTGGDGAIDWSPVAAVSEYVHLVFDGQSNSVGVGAGGLQTTVALPYARRFVGGVRPQDAGTDPLVIYASLVNLIETAGPSSQFETQAGGCCRMIKQLLLAEDGIDLTAAGSQVLLASNPGEGGKSLNDLSTPPMVDRLKDNVTYGYARVAGLGKSYGVNAIAFNQGNNDYQADTSRAVYLQSSLDFQAIVQNQYTAVTGNVRPVPMFFIQTCSHLTYGRTNPKVALAQLDMHFERYGCMVAPDFLIGGVTTPGWQSDSIHYLGPSSLKMGAYYGLAMKRWLWDGVKPEPLRPVKAERFGNTVMLQYTPVGPLVFDTSLNADPGHYGFTMVDGASVDMPIATVELVGPDLVAVRTVSTSAIPVGAAIRIGWIGDTKHGICNLRDSQGTTIIFEPAGPNIPLHRWQPIDEIILA